MEDNVCVREKHRDAHTRSNCIIQEVELQDNGDNNQSGSLETVDSIPTHVCTCKTYPKTVGYT